MVKLLKMSMALFLDSQSLELVLIKAIFKIQSDKIVAEGGADIKEICG